MMELYPADAELNALSGTTDAECGVAYPSIYESPYYTTFYKMLYRLLSVARRASDLRVYKDGDLTFGVQAGMLMNGDTLTSYVGATAQPLTDNATNSIYLTAGGSLTVSTAGFPSPSATPHIRLAEIVTADGSYDFADLTDCRGTGFLTLATGLNVETSQAAATFFSTTDITAAEAETLTDRSTANSLHTHDLVCSDNAVVCHDNQAVYA